jgi:hypothetical protein
VSVRRACAVVCAACAVVRAACAVRKGEDCRADDEESTEEGGFVDLEEGEGHAEQHVRTLVVQTVPHLQHRLLCDRFARVMRRACRVVPSCVCDDA